MRPVGTGRGERGQATGLVALALVVLLGAVALSVDVGRSMLAQFRMQAATDAAALAGAQAMSTNPTGAAGVAKAYAAANGVANAVVSVSASAGQVTVRAAADVPTLMARVLGIFDIPVAVVSHALAPTYPTCWGGSCNPNYNVPGGSGDADGSQDSDGSGGSTGNPTQATTTNGGHASACPQVLVNGQYTCVSAGSDQFGLAPLYISESVVASAFGPGGCAWTAAGCPKYEIKSGSASSDTLSNRGALSLGGTGASVYEQNLASGAETGASVGDNVNLLTKPGVMEGPTDKGLAALCAADNNAPYAVIVVAHAPGEGRTDITVQGFAVVRVDCGTTGPFSAPTSDGSVWGQLVAALLPSITGPHTVSSAQNFGFSGQPSLTLS